MNITAMLAAIQPSDPERKRPEKEMLARLYLLHVAEPPAPALSAFVARQPSAAHAADRVRAGDVPAAVAEETQARRDQDFLARDLTEAVNAGARLLIPEDPQWPKWRFSALDVATNRDGRWAGTPLALWVRGNDRLAELTDRAVALVGARAASDYGEQLAAELGHALSTHGFTVVSGAAYGIDGFAHRGALSADSPTVAVLGCGIDQSYPRGHDTLLRQITRGGAVVSEYAPGTPPLRHRFLIRNRLIAALSSGTVVVEAGRRSGARNTATTAAALGRVVLAVPGRFNAATSIGCHELIRSGEATLVGCVEDVLEAVGQVGEGLSPRAPEARRETDGLDDRSLRVFEALSARTPRSPEQVAILSGIRVDGVRAALTSLELRELAVPTDSGWRAKEPAKDRDMRGDT